MSEATKPGADDLAVFQSEVAAWHLENFGEIDPTRPLLVAVEELGELAAATTKAEQAHLKRYQGRDYNAEAKDAVGDVVIALAAYCARRGWSLADIVPKVWAEVSQRFQGEDKP